MVTAYSDHDRACGTTFYQPIPTTTPKGPDMQIDKNEILKLLRSRGEADKAAQAEQELPEKVDPDEHGGLLERFGVNPKDLLSKLGGLGKLFDKG